MIFIKYLLFFLIIFDEFFEFSILGPILYMKS